LNGIDYQLILFTNLKYTGIRMGLKGLPKTPGSGRKKGTPNKPTATLLEKTRELGIDPFEILLRFAAEDWKGLGYDSRTTISYTSAGIEFEEYVIKPELRGKCASEACQYIHAKRKAIEQTIDPALVETIKSLEGKSEKELLDIVNSVRLESQSD
jgi:hypothetical protein